MENQDLETVIALTVKKTLELYQDGRVAYTIEEAAPLVGVSTKALQNAISAGELPAKKRCRKWLIRPDALIKWASPRM